jgi:hypothetical protein
MAGFLSSAVDITPPGGGIRTVDLSSYVSAETEGVIIRVVNTSTTTAYRYMLRKYGSSDYRYGSLPPEAQCFAFIGVSGNRKIEVEDENVSYLKFYLEGYLENWDYCEFFTNAYDKTPTEVNSWATIDCSSETGGNGFILIFELNADSDYNFGIRRPGSTNEHILPGRHVWLLSNCDSESRCEFYRTSTSQTLHLVGYIAHEYTTGRKNGVSVGINNNWTEVETYGPVPGTTIALLEIAETSGERFDARGTGSSDEFFYRGYHSFAMVEVDSDWVYQLRNEGDVYEIGWFGIRQYIGFKAALSNPGDGESYQGTSITAYPIPEVREGDLVIAVVLKTGIDSMPNFYVEETGGLNWQKLCDLEPSDPSTRPCGAVFWARATGKWLNPAVFTTSNPNNTGMSVIVMDFCPNEQEEMWELDVSPIVSEFDEPSPPYDVEVTDIESSMNSIKIAGWVSNDDNEWEEQSGWYVVFGPMWEAQFRNTWITRQMSFAGSYRTGRIW